MIKALRSVLFLPLVALFASCSFTEVSSAPKQAPSPPVPQGLKLPTEVEMHARYAGRCEPLFKKLRHGVWEGMTSRQFAREMEDVSWVDKARKERCSSNYSDIPVDYSFDRNSVWLVRPYWLDGPNPRGPGRFYHMWISLETKGNSLSYDDAEITKFMKGQIRDASVRLHQICLVSPRGPAETCHDKEERIPGRLRKSYRSE